MARSCAVAQVVLTPWARRNLPASTLLGDRARMGYQGRERRLHKVYITRNTEYHLRDGICVAVRDRNTHVFRLAHVALNLRIEGGVRLGVDGVMIPDIENPDVGDAIFFTHVGPRGETKQIVTSRVERVGRPLKTEVALYPSLRHA